MKTAALQGPLALVFLVGLAVGSWWLANRGTETGTTTTAAARRQPGYYLRDATLEQTDATGRLELRVNTRSAEQDPATRDVRLRELRVDYYPDAERTWVATAEQGTLPPDGQTVFLEGDVRLTGRTGAGTKPAVITTEQLKLDVERSLATTSAPVRIELAPHAVTARGLRADLKRDRVQLESSVNGRFTR